MKRVAWILTVLGILCVAAGQAQAHDFYRHGHNGVYHGVVRFPVPPWIAPQVIVDAPPPPVVVYPRGVYYPPAYLYQYYEPLPSGGFYYRGRGLSIGVGW